MGINPINQHEDDILLRGKSMENKMETLYKYSQFNIEVDKYKGKTYIYNTYSSNGAWVADEEITFLKNGNFINEELIESSILVPYEIDEVQRYLGEVNKACHDDTHLQFTIAVTKNCNYRCFYCFERNHISNIDCNMNQETMDNVIDFIIREAQKRDRLKKITIQWFGGEPLLNIDAIKYITSELKERYINNHTIELVGLITTNGRLLTVETVNELTSNYNIKGCCITLDGLAKDYAKIKGCTESDFYKVIENIRLNQNKINIAIRLNVSNNVDALKNVIKFIEDERIKVRITYDHVWDTDLASEEYLESYGAFVGKSDELDKYIKTVGTTATYKIYNTNKKLACCIANQNNHFAINVDGKLSRCNERIMDAEHSIGNVIDGVTDNELDSRFIDNPLYDKCYECSHLPMCLGKCAMERLIENKGINCEAVKQIHINKLRHKYTEDVKVVLAQAYKYSQFNIPFHEDEKYIWVYNTYSTKVAKIPKTKNKLYQRLNPIPLIVVEEGLVKAQILVPADLDEIQRLKDEAHKEIDRTDNLFLSIFTTLACNYRCVYCFESAQLCNTEHMTTETADDIINFVKRKVEENNITRQITIKWFGGEPLLNFPIIEYITNNLRNNNIEVSAMMYTNGRLLTKETALKLRDLGVNKQVVIPLDGLAPTYAKLKQCSESDFYTVIKNIQDCQDILNIIIHINVSEASKDDADELYRQLREDYKITSQIIFSPISPQNTNLVSDNNNLNLDNLHGIYTEHSISTSGMRAKVGCESRLNYYYVIGPDGNVYICEHQIGKEDYIEGNIRDINSLNRVGTIWDIDKIVDECSSCEYLPACLGRCTSQRYIDNIDCQKDLRIQQLQKDLIKRFK